MSEEAENESTEETPQETSEATPTIESLTTELEKWKSLSRKNEAAKKTALEERDSIQTQFDEASQTIASLKEMGELADQFKAKNTELQDALNSTQTENKRLKIARTHGLSDDLFEFLTSETDEGLEEQAKKLATLASTSDKNSNFIVRAEGEGATPLNSPKLEQALTNALR